MSSPTIAERINHRRRQVLVHSCIYYKLCNSIITDAQFDRWARELVELQKQYPNEASKCIYPKDFESFDATTGFDLPIHEEWVVNTARNLLEYAKTHENTSNS